MAELARCGAINGSRAAKAIRELDVDPEKVDPLALEKFLGNEFGADRHIGGLVCGGNLLATFVIREETADPLHPELLDNPFDLWVGKYVRRQHGTEAVGVFRRQRLGRERHRHRDDLVLGSDGKDRQHRRRSQRANDELDSVVEYEPVEGRQCVRRLVVIVIGNDFDLVLLAADVQPALAVDIFCRELGRPLHRDSPCRSSARKRRKYAELQRLRRSCMRRKRQDKRKNRGLRKSTHDALPHTGVPLLERPTPIAIFLVTVSVVRATVRAEANSSKRQTSTVDSLPWIGTYRMRP